ncbi:MAG: hypothetical protein SPH66_06205 [Gemmiger sp.]|jgi:uncharacterized lipoprotein YajG|uniref:hypothetical protein n=1 Tax=Gemmiger sp. TaxID=2049027 RepID=UPI002A7F946B|nr:hypothetical protein [Gemmiger sp.]MCI6385669.1 hypothetical protein [Subdoligranulum variabile]MDD6425746.1 hypothetical protein [Subdoligranulum variabile]MDD6610099.1 hypothetical protein [Subdoligranulum variabile]MDD6649481.1 hypothetical protein [Subdoligranulum variabile]MDY4447247.1 hypothetical protein [Gemmiger sp.]
MKHTILHPAALLLPLALLAGCARTPDMTPVWQKTLPGSGAKATLSNCTLRDETEVDYIYSREDQNWKKYPALFTTPSPVLTLTGVTADQVELRFSEQIADLYLGYDRVMPQPKLDYIFTETADGALQYQLDTVYNYEFIVTTETGTDDFLIICEQE